VNLLIEILSITKIGEAVITVLPMRKLIYLDDRLNLIEIWIQNSRGVAAIDNPDIATILPIDNLHIETIQLVES